MERIPDIKLFFYSGFMCAPLKYTVLTLEEYTSSETELSGLINGAKYSETYFVVHYMKIVSEKPKICVVLKRNYRQENFKQPL